MSIQFKIDDLGFSSPTEHVEAYRRAVEIRSLNLAKNGNSSQGRWEHFSWNTRTDKGVQKEKVVFDLEERTLSYSFNYEVQVR